ncbi:MAG: metalloregulator ArsR/SmtB family transcription factor [Candidatus Aminicenantes bacterium]|nr:metalloregulator ArsR/SmtB family transcription factor [Candidatus Aminicenantes bacterium]
MKLLLEQLLDMLKALSDKTRLRIFWVLKKADRELCVCEIIDAIEENQYNVSRHLKILKYSGLVTEQKNGRFVYYAISKAGNRVHKLLLEMVSAISNDTLPYDSKRLLKRLSLRKDGICVIGMQDKKHKK